MNQFRPKSDKISLIAGGIMKVLYIGENSSFFNSLEGELLQGDYELLSTNLESELIPLLDQCSLIVIDNEFSKSHDTDIMKSILDWEKKRGKKNIPLLFVSDSDDFDERLNAFNSGADEFVDKFDIKSIHLKINSFLRPDLLWQGLNTILVEDDKISAKFISHVLKSKGAKVHHFLDGISAFEYIKENPQVDLILTDHIMPNLTGIAFVKKIRNEIGLKNVPIIFISSVQDKVEILEFYKVGGNDYIAKPLIKEELFVKVNQLLEIRIKSDILKAQVDELEKLNRLKDQFIAVCSHDLRTPLNTILGLSNNILTEEDDVKEIKEQVSVIDNSATDLLSMVNELLDFGELQLKKNDVELEKVNIGETLKNCIRKISSFNTKHIAMSFKCYGPEDVFIMGNRSMLTRAFNNIITNSYKFTGESGQIRGLLESKGGKVILSISDTGIGIPEKYKEHIFDQLSGAGREGLEGEKSVGLGMSIVKDIIDKHSGEIELTSREGKGTTVKFSFNMVKA